MACFKCLLFTCWKRKDSHDRVTGIGEGTLHRQGIFAAPRFQYQEEEGTVYPQGRMQAAYEISQRMGGRVDGNQRVRCLLLFTGGRDQPG